MKPRAARVVRTCLAGMLLALLGCASPQPKEPEPAPAPLDASYDWHVLLIAPLGSVLRDIPATMHEVLLFRDEQQNSAAADELECYAVDGKLPRFEATVRLPADEAEKIFADACALWGKSGQPSAEGCEGSDRGVAYIGHLDSEPQGSETAMTVQLDAVEAATERSPDRRERSP